MTREALAWEALRLETLHHEARRAYDQARLGQDPDARADTYNRLYDTGWDLAELRKQQRAMGTAVAA